MHSSIRCGLLGLALTATPVPASIWTDAIVGDWRGTSICVDRVHFPACNDEQVIYEARLTHAAPDTVTIGAYKLVNGEPAFMGDYALTLQADSTWASDFRYARAHLLLKLRVNGDSLSGMLKDLTSGYVVRDIKALRIPADTTASRGEPAGSH